MAYYDRIAQRWHDVTGAVGGAFKDLVLNDILLEKLPGIDTAAILELGAGNGYFLPLVLRHFAGQAPASLTVTDLSGRQLDLARRHFSLPGASYARLDIGRPWPFARGQFDTIIASMVFNEVPAPGFKMALRECRRVLAGGGLFLMAVSHPDFIDGLRRKGLLKPAPEGGLSMPGTGSLRLPVVIRSMASYRRALQEAGFAFEETEGYLTPQVLNLIPGLRNAWKVPVALVCACR